MHLYLATKVSMKNCKNLMTLQAKKKGEIVSPNWVKSKKTSEKLF